MCQVAHVKSRGQLNQSEFSLLCRAHAGPKESIHIFSIFVKHLYLALLGFLGKLSTPVMLVDHSPHFLRQCF